MNTRKIFAISAIYIVACIGWAILGTTTDWRSETYFRSLSTQVGDLWGRPLTQKAPSLAVQIPGSDKVRWVMPVRNDLQIALTPDYRKKGLIWYPTFVCRFNSRYTLINEEEVIQKLRLHMDFPDPQATYDDFSATVDTQPLPIAIDPKEGIDYLLELAPGESKTFALQYQTRGMGSWRYQPDKHTGRVKDLNLEVKTVFKGVDYTDGSLSPTSMEPTPQGMRLVWQASDLITRADIGVVVPERLNPGPLTSRITFFAPVCLIFFFVLISTIAILCKISIHPMHYLFVAAGFFAFHLLLSYMVGLINIHLAFVLAAAISVALVTAYLTAAVKPRFPWKVAAVGQLFYLVLFSYSFFLQGITGLTVAVGSVVTLAVLMKVTANLDWDIIFKKPPAPSGAALASGPGGPTP
jgi:hypothetical protein